MSRLVVLTVLFSGCAAAQDAIEILKKVEEKYKSLNTYQAVIGTVSDTKYPTGQSYHEQRVRYSYKAPEKNRSESLVPQIMPMTYASDGEFQYTLNEHTKEYIKRAVTKQVETPAAERRAFKLVENSETASVLREEEISVDGRPTACWVIDRKVKPQPASERMKVLNSEWWIAKDSYLFIKVAERREFENPFSGKQLMNSTTTWSEIRENPDIPDGFFAFTPPDGFKEVANFSMPERSSKGKLDGQPAPAFRLKDTNGTERSLESFKGKAVILNFWATWCAPCRAEMPFIELLHRSFKDKGLVVVGVDDEEAKTAQEYLEKNRYTFLSLVDEGTKVKNAYNVDGIPTTFLIDREGKIMMTSFGSMGNAELKEQLEKLGIW